MSQASSSPGFVLTSPSSSGTLSKGSNSGSSYNVLIALRFSDTDVNGGIGVFATSESGIASMRANQSALPASFLRYSGSWSGASNATLAMASISRELTFVSDHALKVARMAVHTCGGQSIQAPVGVGCSLKSKSSCCSFSAWCGIK